MLKIILADLQNSFFGLTRNSVPLNIGYLAEYTDLKIIEPKTIFLTRRLEELIKLATDEHIDVIGFAFYSWNHSLVIKAANEIKRISPKTLIVFGGPSVSENPSLAKNILDEASSVDYLIANEGEQPFVNLLKAYLQDPSTVLNGAKEVLGCYGFNRINQQFHGQSLERFEGDINEIPSPYLSGRLDKFLKEPMYLPIVQTARGCPYGCTFCVSGKRSWNKLRTFSIDRIKDEFWYIQKRSASTYLRLADENFGLLPRDVEIAKLMRAMKDRTGYPDSVSIYTDKHPSDRVLEINLLLSDILPFNISFQSMTEPVLKNIKRINIADDRINLALNFARANDLMLVTELIFGLPGETVETFLSSIDKTVRLRFESVILIQLYILKGTEMDDPIHRKKYGVKTKYMISENGYTDYQNIQNVEVDEWVTETSTIDAETYANFNKTILMFDIMHGYGFARELMFLFEALNVPPSKLLLALVSNANKAPVLNAYANNYMNTIQSLLRPTKEEAVNFALKAVKESKDNRLTGVLEAKRDVMIDILLDCNLKTILNEIANAGASLVGIEALKSLPLNWQETLLQEAIEFCHLSVVDLENGLQDTIKSFNYDFYTWKNNKYQGIPKPIESREEFKFYVVSKSTVQAIISDVNGSRSKYRKFFSITNSRTNRRKCELSSDINASEPILNN